MPTYGYRCKSCNHAFEVVQSINDAPIKDCPKCGAPVNKIFFPVGIAFKGSGFHVNDYKSPRRATAEKAANASADVKSNGNGNGSECSSCTSTSTCEIG